MSDFATADRGLSHAELARRFSLEQPQVKPPLPKMVSQRLQLARICGVKGLAADELDVATRHGNPKGPWRPPVWNWQDRPNLVGGRGLDGASVTSALANDIVCSAQPHVLWQVRVVG